LLVSIVVAVAENGVIGRDGGLPWRLPDESKHFKQLTLGHHLAMGRLTFESMGRPLPGRTSIVVTHSPGYAREGANPVPSLDAALAFARERGESECFVIGGASLYAKALPIADRLWLTRVHAVVDGDVEFPAFTRANWRRVEERFHPEDERHAFAFTIEHLERVRPGTPAGGARPVVSE